MRLIPWLLAASACGDPSTAVAPKIEHVVLIVQENHTFDAYFGTWCQAPAGSNPSCTRGPDCCEAAPTTDPAGVAPSRLDDDFNAARDHLHTQDCELREADGGAMDLFTSPDPSISGCGGPENFALASSTEVGLYRTWASQYAIADRYFQPISGSSSSNDMYLAGARYAFTDNDDKPDSSGAGCQLPGTQVRLTNPTIADLLVDNGLTFAAYAEGYQSMKDAWLCPLPPSDCGWHLPSTPCTYDPSDVPFEYYARFRDDPTYMKDLGAFQKDLDDGALPSFAYVKGLGYHDEHPGYATKITDGVAFVQRVVDAVMGSSSADSTLILVTWDEGGGFFDHIAPPGMGSDGQPYGTRVPLIAIGRFARAGEVSHVVMEHSSIVKFLEQNFLGATGQLGARDVDVQSIDSLLRYPGAGS
jgi:phospholipase C